MIQHFCPLPRRGGLLERKIHYFYLPYNYEVNTQKFMKFEEQEEEEDQNEYRMLNEPLYNDFDVSEMPWTLSRP